MSDPSKPASIDYAQGARDALDAVAADLLAVGWDVRKEVDRVRLRFYGGGVGPMRPNTTKYAVFFEDGRWTESRLEIRYDEARTFACGETWPNDSESDHVHRCLARAPHDDYHQCGHTWGDNEGVPTLCGVQW